MIPALLKNNGRLHDYTTEVLEQSEGTFSLKGPWFTNMDMMITSDPANVHYLLTKNFPNFPKGPEFKEIFDIFGDGIFGAEYESWESQRKAVKALIMQPRFQELVATTSWNKVETGLIPIMELVSETGMEVDVQELFQRFAFDCSCILVLGHDPTSLCKELPHLPHVKAFADIEEALLYRHILPHIWKLQRWLQVGKERKLKVGMENVDQFLSHWISVKQQNHTVAGKEDFDVLSSYMRAAEGNGDDEPNIPQEIWRDSIMNLIVAGKDTISATLTWFFWLLATNPAEEEKIRQEISTNFQMMSSHVGKWEFTDVEELRKLIYLHAALCETLRLFPPVAIQHKTSIKHDILPTGHHIKPNTIMLLPFYSMGRMKSIWGEDCLQFKPGRWISESGRIRNEPSYKFTAFNAGPRSCLGKEMSFTQMKIVAAAIISRFKIQVAEGHPVCPSASVILHMKHGLKVKVSKYE
ncbi:Alkane hydroxylase MAH1 [Sesamum alatum]|uniref:Alkane hydroxylase MAH1 n=1 Tax=Sesamum alatum TaxID=300844 RepID=A0AAE2CYR3_9LAMI|nr:Alkane hydroxylase MAH1 [Sesamum alatum]